MSRTPDTDGNLLIGRRGREWHVTAVPVAGRSAAFGHVNTRRDAQKLRAMLLDEIPGRDLHLLLDEQGLLVDDRHLPLLRKLAAVGEAAPWVAWRQRNGVCLECGIRACGSAYNGGTCTKATEPDRFRGGHIPADLRRWAA
ncbi:hypothetical protein [Glutamicibacter sp. V16R2B1]|uniref:hypothetical protein n=1 Tax=Glutamicibacter sp. V16R2B1 TaxID=2036207 RepID=UPI0010FF1E01|nr:hypothetical protein [Glutamicibacter sp. V16R2B1]MCK9901339.1 hypothetical protein [Frankia sp. Cpl3]TLK47809.1 hypothetical protein FDN03_15615 [Glutamicibacter sp. V16R2B1]